MARTKKTKTAAAEAAQKVQEAQAEPQDIRGAETVSTAPEIAQDPYQDLMEPDPAPGPAEEAREGPGGAEDEEQAAFVDYAVAKCDWLRLRQEPSLDAPVVTKLPRGVGVLGFNRPAEDGWRQVFTGRLSGWVKDEFLEPLGPEGDDGG